MVHKTLRRTNPLGSSAVTPNYAMQTRRSIPGCSLKEPPGIITGSAHLGGTPMTLTPAPRAWSMAQITLEYFTVVSPFTKMIFSGRADRRWA